MKNQLIGGSSLLKNNLFVEAYYQWMADNGVNLNQNPDYKRLSDCFDKILSEMGQYLLEDKKDLAFELDSLFGTMAFLEARMSYYYGFKDGANFILDIKG